jgi:hypothetical protein
MESINARFPGRKQNSPRPCRKYVHDADHRFLQASSVRDENGNKPTKPYPNATTSVSSCPTSVHKNRVEKSGWPAIFHTLPLDLRPGSRSAVWTTDHSW